MVKFDEHGNCENKIDTWKLAGHPTETRQDSSVVIRDGLRALWGVGEQLWDVDVNNYALLQQQWCVGEVDQTRAPRANVNVDPEKVSYIDRGIIERLEYHLNSRCYPMKDTWCERPQKSKKFYQDMAITPPLHARFTYSAYDELMYIYRDRKGWTAMGEVRPCSPRVEVSIYRSWAKANSTFASVIFSKPCRFFSGVAHMSNSMPIEDKCKIVIEKSGVGMIGGVTYSDKSGIPVSSVYFTKTVDFAPDDVMWFKCLNMSQSEIAFSFIGQRL